MNFKKRLNGSWVDTSCYIHKTATDTFANLPATLYPTGVTSTVELKGNTVQNGTPTPQNPIQPSECGDRTGNMFNLSSYFKVSANISDIIINENSITYNAHTPYISIIYKFNLGIADVYTISLGGDSFNTRLELRYIKNGSAVGNTIIIQPNQKTTVRGSDKYDEFRIYISNGNNTGTCIASNIMLNTGSTPLPYEPYGYKIPISSANTTTPVYLGEVETTRRIKKLVLYGTENLTFSNSDANRTVCYLTNLGCADSLCLCTHIEGKRSYSSNEYNRILTYTDFNGVLYISIEKELVGSTLETFKSYLAAQYAAGTPVTVWYVLAEPETAVVNEPLMKIGNYADIVSDISVLVTAGGDTISVDTTVQPSGVAINYKGWHNAKCKEYSYNMTIADWESASISQMENHTIQELQGGNWV